MIRRLQHRQAQRLTTALALLALVLIWVSVPDVCWDCNVHEVSIEDLIVGTSPPRDASRIAKVTVAANKLDSPVIHRALVSHQVQNELHGYSHFLATKEAVTDLVATDSYHNGGGTWTKPAFLLSIMVAELEKPVADRLEWLLYVRTSSLLLRVPK